MEKLTGGLCTSQRLAFLIVADSIHIYHVLCLWCQSSQSVTVSARGQPLIYGSSTARLLVAEPVACDRSSRRQPVDGEGGGFNVGEVQASRGIQGWIKQVWK